MSNVPIKTIVEPCSSLGGSDLSGAGKSVCLLVIEHAQSDGIKNSTLIRRIVVFIKSENVYSHQLTPSTIQQISNIFTRARISLVSFVSPVLSAPRESLERGTPANIPPNALDRRL
jgi:hypothetical protein